MAETTYEGAWLRSQKDWYGEEERFTVSGPTDAAHGDMQDAGAPLMMDAPVLQGGGEIYTDVVFENTEHLVPATLIDETPVSGHGNPEESGHGYGGLTRPGADISELAIYRGQDDGAAKRATTSTTMYRFWHDKFFGFFTKGFEPPPIAREPSSPIFVRGLNSMAVNDGDGGRPTSWKVDADIAIVGGTWRRGDYEGSNIQRHFAPPDRRHGDIKYVESDHTTIIGDAPPPAKSDVYASPFSSLQKFSPKRRLLIGGIRRDPAPWDEDVVANSGVSGNPPSADGTIAP